MPTAYGTYAQPLTRAPPCVLDAAGTHNEAARAEGRAAYAKNVTLRCSLCMQPAAVVVQSIYGIIRALSLLV